MRFSEFLNSPNAELESVIVNTLINLRGEADDAEQTSEISFDALQKIIQNIGYPTFNHNLFKSLYDQGSALKNIVDDFDQEKIIINTEKEAEKDVSMNKDDMGSTDKVKQMAQRALKKRS